MASVSGAYNSATSYTVTVTGMTVGQKYHLFIADLDASGSTTGYYCRYTQTATSSGYTYNGTCGSAYSAYNRTVRLYCTGTTATSHSVGVKYQENQLPTSYTENKTAYMVAWGGGGGEYKVKIKLGAGIRSIGIGINSTTASVNATVDTTLTVGSGGWLYLTGISYETDYTYPVIATDQTSSPYNQWTVVSSSGGWSDHYVSAPSSSGTRTVNISATYAPTYYYRVTAHANGGTFASGADLWSMSYSTTDSYVTYYLNTIATPSRSGYTFKGWGSSASATTVYGSTITFAVGSTSASSPTVKEVYAVWERKSIAPFYWASAATDATLIAKGEPVSNLTSARWNSLMAKIREVAEAEGKTFSYSSVSSGGTFYATEFNEARNGILNLTGYGALPAAQSAGGQVKAALLEGSGSLKSALNAAIDHYNNS